MSNLLFLPQHNYPHSLTVAFLTEEASDYEKNWAKRESIYSVTTWLFDILYHQEQEVNIRIWSACTTTYRIRKAYLLCRLLCWFSPQTSYNKGRQRSPTESKIKIGSQIAVVVGWKHIALNQKRLWSKTLPIVILLFNLWGQKIFNAVID